MRAFYWTETVQEAGREALDAARRHRRYALTILVGLLIAAIGLRFIAGDGGWRTDLIVATACFVAVAGLFGALFFWKLISIPPRRHAAQMKEISSLSSALEQLRSRAQGPS